MNVQKPDWGGRIPYIFMLVIFVYWCWWGTQPLPFYPTGVDWGQYIMGAEYLWRWTPELTYPEWRHPLYSYLLGLCAMDSYAQAARLLNVIGGLLGLLSFAWVGWRSQRPWLGVLGMSIWMLHPLTQDARGWINPYFLWGGVIGTICASAWTMFKESFSVRFVGLTILFGGIGLWLDGRTIWVLSVILCSVALMQEWKVLGTLTVCWLGLVSLETMAIQHYDIDLYGLWTQLEMQRAYLFREDMALQLFPATEEAAEIASVCMNTASTLWPIEWSCSVQMGWGNLRAWLDWGQLPPLVLLLMLGVGQIFVERLNRRLLFCMIIAVAIPLLVMGLVWQPPRYLFWTLWIWIAILAFTTEGLLWNPRTRLLGGLSIVMLGYWMYTSPALNSIDQPKDWASTGRLVSEQVGESVLDCTERGYMLSQLSSHRALEWSMIVDPVQCESWMTTAKLTSWGVDTVLSEKRFPTPNGWKLETGFDFQAGALWMYRRLE